MKKYRIHKKVYVIATVVILLLGATYLVYRSNNNYLAKVNSEEISVDEFKMIMNDNIANTVSYFSEKYNADIKNSDYWTTSFEGEIPLEVLKKRTLDKCIENKTQQIVAKEKGIVDSITFEDFKENLKKENERRLKCIEEKEPIYGPQQYSERDYYQYLLGDMTTKVKEQIMINEINVTEDQLEGYYNEIKDTYFKEPNTVKVEIMSIEAMAADKEKARENLKAIKEDINNNKDINSLIKEYNIKLVNKDFTPDTVREDERMNEELKNIVYELEPSEVSDVMETIDGCYIVKCIDVKENGYKEFLEVDDLVKAYYVEDIYESVLSQKLASNKIEINEKIYSKIKVQ